MDGYLDLETLRATPLATDPYEHVIVREFVTPEARSAVNADYPRIEQSGSLPLSALKFGSAFQGLVSALEGDGFRRVVEQKFGLDLTGKPTTVTVRGNCCERDGRIHTDSKTKIITVLIYFNPTWSTDGGRLRLLRSGTDLDDYAIELPPDDGTLLIFLRSDRSFHGHKPFVGPRRAVQFNWVTSERSQKFTMLRHRISSLFKRSVSPQQM
ncbi:MAG: 2OG-Fe(II) oxygenase [Phycisphaerales bacterium]|nr:2OG-Fe(II) oxygenase [Phycisphaerales bacterium]